jgi:LPXTG-site transpeptidase (sortase) family protein
MSTIEARRADHRVGRRAIGALVALCAAAAILTSALAAVEARRGGDVVLDAPDAVAAEPPATLPPRVTTTNTADPSPSPVPTSPLAASLGPRLSAIPTPPAERPRPIGFSGAELRLLGFPIVDVGVDGEGEFDVPDHRAIGWYRYGSAPGEPGATVLAAHVNWRGKVGPFARLGKLEPGDRVDVALDDGTSRTYEVVERTMYPKVALPAERIWTTTGDETLVLITCGGQYVRRDHRYLDNIVVYAVPVADSATPLAAD